MPEKKYLQDEIHSQLSNICCFGKKIVSDEQLPFPESPSFITYRMVALFSVLMVLLLTTLFVWKTNLQRKQISYHLEGDELIYQQTQTQTISAKAHANTRKAQKKLPQGKIPFTVSSGQKTGPQFREGFIDPYDPQVGEKQTFQIKILGKQPVERATLTLQTDTITKTYALQLIAGDQYQGLWQGEWITEDTHNYLYVATIEATDSQATNKIDITLR